MIAGEPLSPADLFMLEQGLATLGLQDSKAAAVNAIAAHRCSAIKSAANFLPLIFELQIVFLITLAIMQ